MTVEEWERLRETASQIKRHTLARLPEYLEQFEAKRALRLGAHVHWARDAAEHNQIVLRSSSSTGSSGWSRANRC
jgi:L-lactate dehydrogenase complex protein LldF